MSTRVSRTNVNPIKVQSLRKAAQLGVKSRNLEKATSRNLPKTKTTSAREKYAKRAGVFTYEQLAQFTSNIRHVLSFIFEHPYLRTSVSSNICITELPAQFTPDIRRGSTHIFKQLAQSTSNIRRVLISQISTNQQLKTPNARYS